MKDNVGAKAVALTQSAARTNLRMAISLYTSCFLITREKKNPRALNPADLPVKQRQWENYRGWLVQIRMPPQRKLGSGAGSKKPAVLM
jgi:hypothetical protein